MKYRLLSIASLAVLAVVSQASVVFDFRLQYEGNGNPVIPAGKLTITDTDLNTVQLTLLNTADSSDQFIRSLFLNLTAMPANASSSFLSPVKSVTWNEDKINTGLAFDLQIDLARSKKDRLAAGESTTFTLSGFGLDETDFLANCPNNDDVMAMIHVASTPNGDSAKLINGIEHSSVVPEPATIAVLASAFSALAIRRRRR